ncbi:MAG: hypothetical protein EBT09_14585, partial [Actinobacteria bacterium]|nr:hypothetical protein [Actinomycetota bacterium]
AYTVVAANAGAYADGTATVTVSGVDLAGNTGTTVTSGGTFVIDTMAPSVALEYAIASTVPANTNEAEALTYAASASRPVKVGDIIVVKAVTTEATGLASALSLALDGNRTITALEPYTASGSVGTTYFNHTVASGNDGTATVSVTAPDTAGNAAVASGTTTFVIDTTPPTVTLAYSDRGPTAATGPYKSGDSVTVTATFTETNALSGIPTLTLVANSYTGGTLPAMTLANGSSGLAYTGTFTVPAGDGTVTATVGAVDTAGNTLSATGQTGFTIDNTSPMLRSLLPVWSNPGSDPSFVSASGPAIEFSATFSEPVTDVSTSTFVVNRGPGITGTPAVTSVTTGTSAYSSFLVTLSMLNVVGDGS